MMKYKKKESITYLLVSLVFILLISGAIFFTIPDPKYGLILEKSNLLSQAFFNTIMISFISLIGAMLIGFVLFIMMRSKIILMQALSNVFNEIIMGTPLLVMIFLMMYVVGGIMDYDNKLVLGTIALILYNAPYIANAYESVAAVIDEDQYIVMDLYHFKWYQKYLYVIIPQMIRPFIPSLINNLSSVIKSSSLLNVIAISEITYIVTTIAAGNFAFIEGYYVMWLMYLIVTIPLSLLAKIIGKKVA